MVDRSEIRFAHPVALASLEDAAGAVDAQPGHHVARPAAPRGLLRERLLGGQDTACARHRDVPGEILGVAKQAEAVLHLPGNADIGRDVARRDGELSGGRAARQSEAEERADRGQWARQAAEGDVAHRESRGLSGANDPLVMGWVHGNAPQDRGGSMAERAGRDEERRGANTEWRIAKGIVGGLLAVLYSLLPHSGGLRRDG